MSVEVELLKDMAVKAIELKTNKATAEAYRYLMFGATGLPGLADAAELVLKADKASADKLTNELAVELVQEAAKKTIGYLLLVGASGVLSRLGIPPAAGATIISSIIVMLFESKDIGDDPKPDPTPPAVVPPTGATPVPSPSDPLDKTKAGPGSGIGPGEHPGGGGEPPKPEPKEPVTPEPKEPVAPEPKEPEAPEPKDTPEPIPPIIIGPKS